VPEYHWFKSSFSPPDNANCVEVAFLPDDGAAVRDSKGGIDSPVLTFNSAEWNAFLTGAKAGEFDPAV
jgi:hypothetical protein